MTVTARGKANSEGLRSHVLRLSVGEDVNWDLLALCTIGQSISQREGKGKGFGEKEKREEYTGGGGWFILTFASNPGRISKAHKSLAKVKNKPCSAKG